jgi:hypothetical protein
MRPFTRQRRWRFLRIASAARLTLLAYIFKAVLTRPRTRSVSHSRPRPAFLPYEARSPRATRCPVPSSEPAVCSRAFTPLRDLSIPPARSAQPGSGRRNLPCKMPDFPSLPAAMKWVNISAADQRSGFATSCQARCLSNLSEPGSSCTETLFASIQKVKFSS